MDISILMPEMGPPLWDIDNSWTNCDNKELPLISTITSLFESVRCKIDNLSREKKEKTRLFELTSELSALFQHALNSSPLNQEEGRALLSQVIVLAREIEKEKETFLFHSKKFENLWDSLTLSHQKMVDCLVGESLQKETEKALSKVLKKIDHLKKMGSDLDAHPLTQKKQKKLLHEAFVIEKALKKGQETFFFDLSWDKAEKCYKEALDLINAEQPTGSLRITFIYP